MKVWIDDAIYDTYIGAEEGYEIMIFFSYKVSIPVIIKLLAIKYKWFYGTSSNKENLSIICYKNLWYVEISHKISMF